MNGTVTADVPPISTGYGRASTQKGAVINDVNTPRIGGNPINDASANPYGSAISAATNPPAKSPPKRAHVYSRIDLTNGKNLS